jgi:hypothetical protein
VYVSKVKARRKPSILRPWRWRRHVPPKRQLTLNGFQGVISEMIELLILTDKNLKYIYIYFEKLYLNGIIFFSLCHCQQWRDVFANGSEIIRFMEETAEYKSFSTSNLLRNFQSPAAKFQFCVHSGWNFYEVNEFSSPPRWGVLHSQSLNWFHPSIHLSLSLPLGA